MQLDAIQGSDSSLAAQLAAQLADKEELVQLLERRYNSEHQRGLSLELAGQKAENLAGRLAEENASLKARVAQLEGQQAAIDRTHPRSQGAEDPCRHRPKPKPKASSTPRLT